MNLIVAVVAGLAGGAMIALSRPSFVRAPPPVLLAVLATGSAVASQFAAGSPVGWAGLDAVVRAGFGAGGVLLGASAPPAALLLAAAAGTATAAGSPWRGAVVATLGVIGVTTLSWRRAPLITALAGGVVAQVALRLPTDGVWPGAAAAAAWMTTPVVIWGVAGLDGPARRRVLRIAGGLGALVLGLGSLGVVSALLARSALDRGLAEANAGIAAARRADTAAASAQLSAAARSFADARRTLESWWARPAEAVPVSAQHVRSLRALAATGEQLSALGVDAAVGANLQSIAIHDGQVPLHRIPAVERSAARAAVGLGRARRQLAAARSPWLLPPIGRRFDAQVARLAEAQISAQRARRVLHELPNLLGAAGPRRYFLAVQTPAELRGSGGMIGNYGEITAVDGRLTLARFGRVNELNHGGDPAARTLVAPDDYVARYARFSPETTWQNVTMSPDFPTVAGVITDLYQQSGGGPVDGVIAVDPRTIAAILGVVGPIDVAPWPVPLTAKNASRVLLYEQYVRLEHDARVRFLGDAVEQLWQRLTTGTPAGAGDLLNVLGPVVPGKHLLLASRHPEEQRVFSEVGVAGRMAPAADDFLAVVTQSAGENKIDWFLRKEVDYGVELDPATGKLEVRLKAVLHNDAPPSGLPAYVIGNPVDVALPPGHNRMFLSIYTPWDLDRAEIGGMPADLQQEHELERRVYSAFVVVPPEGSLTIDLRLSGRYRGTGGYRLRLHRQPAVSPDEVRTSLILRPTTPVSGAGPPITSADHLTLDRDRTIWRPFPGTTAGVAAKEARDDEP